MKKLITILVSICFLLLSGIITAQTKNSDAYIKLYNEGFYPEVIAAISQIDSLSRTAQDWFYLASAYNSNNDIKIAVKCFKKAVNQDTLHLGYRINYARTLISNNDSRSAIYHFQKVIEKDSSNVTANYELGLLFMNLKKHSQAKPYFERQISLNKDDYASHYYLALASYNENPSCPDSVIIPNHLASCLLLNPGYSPAHDLLGNYYFVRKEYKAALYSYETATRYRWYDAETQFKTGLCLEKLKLYLPAISCYEKAVKIDSTMMNYYSHLGYCNYISGKLDSATIAYKKAISLDNENPTLYINLGMVYSNMDSISQSRDAFRKAEQYSSQLQIAFIYNQLGYCYLKLGSLKEAKLYCEKTLMLDPANAAAQFNLARINDESGQAKNALKNFETALPLLKEKESMQKEYQFALKRIQELRSK